MVIPALCALMLNTIACATTDKPASSSNKVIPFPDAQEGFNRHVIYLPHLANEQDAKVELLIGKNMNVDCNQHSLSGEVEKVELEGWGFDFLLVKNVDNTMSTLMACKNNQKSEKFVTINGVELQRYNSQLPLVVYAPKDIDVVYRIWHASKDVGSALKNNTGSLPYKIIEK